MWFGFFLINIMETKYKSCVRVGIITIALISLTLLVAGLLRDPLVEPITSLTQSPEQPPLSTEQPSILPQSTQTAWVSFESKKDTGLRLDVQFTYPSTWFQKGSRDSGPRSIVQFFDRTKYSSECETMGNKTNCSEMGEVARISITGPSLIAPEIDYENQKSEKVTIDGRVAAKVSGTVKPESSGHIASSGQVETRVIVENLDRQQRYEFIMVTEDAVQKEAFNEIIKSTKFKVK